MKKFLLILSVIALANCTKSEEELDGNMSTTIYDEDIITIETSMDKPDTKGYIVWSPEDMGTVSLYCERCDSGDKWSSSSTFSHMYDEQLNYENGDWVYEGEPVSWGWESATDRYSFHGYSPYKTADNGISPSIINGNLVIDYTVPSDCKKQPDLTYATPRKDIFLPAGGLVYLDFNHALSLVSFQLRNTKANFIDPNKRIKEIQINSVSSKGTLTVDIDGEAEWSNIETPAKFTAKGNLKIKPTRTEQSVTKDGNYLMMIPQTLEYTTEVIVTLAHELGGCEEQKKFYLPAGTTWEAGQNYSYVIDDDSNIIFERGVDAENPDFTKCSSFSNCYMLHPTVSDRIYYIPVDERINEFWEYYGGSDEFNEMFLISDSYGLKSEVMWYDCANIDGFKVEILDAELNTDVFPARNSGLVTPENEPNYTTEKAQVVMKVTLPANCPDGNICVALWRDLDGDGVNDKETQYSSDNELVALNETLWSWHFWVTSYNPDSEYGGANEYNQVVTGGSIQRYIDDPEQLKDGITALWDDGGIYEDKYIMDRNLGARGIGFGDMGGQTYGAGFVVYQFGRKDPFPGDTYTQSADYNYAHVNIVNAGKKTFSDAVHNPMQFYGGSGNWSSEDEKAAYSLKLLWNDINVPNAYTPTVNNIGGPLDLSNHVAPIGNKGKSIFDPSPLGWKLPIQGVWSDFVVDVDDEGILTDSQHKFRLYNISGQLIIHETIPDGGTDPNAGTYATRAYDYDDCPADARYPFTGYREHSDGMPRMSCIYGFCRTASPSIQNVSYDGIPSADGTSDPGVLEITDFGHMLCIDGWGVKDKYPYVRAHGMPVRPIQE